jgi:hypothetical protein
MENLRTGSLLVLAIVALAWQRAEPETYEVHRAPRAIVIDGGIDDVAWKAAPWTKDFVDIEGSAKPKPALRTHAKMLWDDRYLYIAAELEEPHVWATLRERDAVIFHDNDFEVFIDPDGDTFNYYELEINALGTVWDLFLTRPYRHGGIPLNAWDIRGLKSAVRVSGSLNDARDKDRGWSVELALPWETLREAAPKQRKPNVGEKWRLNFSRVAWDVDIRRGKYVKRKQPEHNWVWSAQGEINMHIPERWGVIRFAN